MLGEEGQLEGLMAALERRGVREGALYSSLLRHSDALAARMPAGPLRCATPLALLSRAPPCPPVHPAHPAVVPGPRRCAHAAFLQAVPHSCSRDQGIDRILERRASELCWQTPAR